MYKRQEIHLRLGRLEFYHQVLVADIVDEAILGVNVRNAYGFIVDFKNNVLKITGEEVMLTTSEKLIPYKPVPETRLLIFFTQRN